MSSGARGTSKREKRGKKNGKGRCTGACKRATGRTNGRDACETITDRRRRRSCCLSGRGYTDGGVGGGGGPRVLHFGPYARRPMRTQTEPTDFKTVVTHAAPLIRYRRRRHVARVVPISLSCLYNVIIIIIMLYVKYCSFVVNILHRYNNNNMYSIRYRRGT